MENKYNNLYYWEKELIKGNKPGILYTKITKETVFFYGVIASGEGKPEKRWLHFPNIDSLIGFLQYGFIPEAFARLHHISKAEIMGQYYSLEELIDWIMFNNRLNPAINVAAMYRIEKFMNDLWLFPKEQLSNRLDWLQRFYDGYFNRRVDQYTYFKLYYTPEDVGKYIVSDYLEEQQLTLGEIEKRLGMTKEQWLAACGQVYSSPFLSRTFTQIITNRLC